MPTAGLIVKGCLDACNVCEPELHREIELDLERKKLENERLKREIELMGLRISSTAAVHPTPTQSPRRRQIHSQIADVKISVAACPR